MMMLICREDQSFHPGGTASNVAYLKNMREVLYLSAVEEVERKKWQN